jgi:hypothetical protein
LSYQTKGFGECSYAVLPVTMEPEVLYMRTAILVVSLAGGLAAQSMTDVAAATAGGVAGAAAGKTVSDGISGVFGKVARATEKAAGTVKAPAPVAAPVQQPPHVVATAVGPQAPLIEAGPGLPKSGGVPLPPPPTNKAFMEKPVAPPPAPEPVVAPEPPPPPPPPPEATADDLRKIVEGTSREELLKLGEPAFRITMFEEGHLEETFRYSSHNVTLGTVRLVDGAVAKVEVK